MRRGNAAGRKARRMRLSQPGFPPGFRTPPRGSLPPDLPSPHSAATAPVGRGDSSGFDPAKSREDGHRRLAMTNNLAGYRNSNTRGNNTVIQPVKSTDRPSHDIVDGSLANTRCTTAHKETSPYQPKLRQQPARKIHEEPPHLAQHRRAAASANSHNNGSTPRYKDGVQTASSPPTAVNQRGSAETCVRKRLATTSPAAATERR